MKYDSDGKLIFGSDEYPSEVITRAAAKKAKMPHYFTGERCVKGHLSARSNEYGYCVECTRKGDG